MRKTDTQQISKRGSADPKPPRNTWSSTAILIVTNTYLKLTILILAAVSLATLHSFLSRTSCSEHASSRSSSALTMSAREAVDYQNFTYKPQEAENRYFLSSGHRGYYSRNHYDAQRLHEGALLPERRPVRTLSWRNTRRKK